MRDLLVLAINMAGLVLSFVRAEWAVCFYMFLAFSRLQDFAFGWATYQPWSQVSALVTLFTMFRTGVYLPWVDSWLSRILIALAVWLAFTSTIGLDAGHSWEILQQFLKVLLMVFVSARIINTPKRLRLLVLVVVGAFAFHGLKFGLYGLLKGFPHNLEGPGGQLADNNSFGMAMATTFPMMLWAIGQVRNKFGKLAFIGYLPLHLTAIMCTYSRGAFVNLFIGSMILLSFSRNKIRNMLLVPAIIAAIIPFLPQAYMDRIGTIGDSGAEAGQTSNASRMALIQYGFGLFTRNIVFGSGHDLYMTAAYEDLGPGHDHLTHHLPHNAFILIGVEAGAVGVGLYIVMFATAFLTSAQVAYDKWVKANMPLYSGLARCMMACLGGYFLNNMLNNYPYHELGYFLILLAICLTTIVARMKHRKPKPPKPRRQPPGPPAEPLPQPG